MLMVFEIKGNVIRTLSYQYYHFPQSVCIAYFIENIWISACHIGDNNIRFTDLIKDAVQHTFSEYLFIQSFSICTGFGRSYFDT